MANYYNENISVLEMFRRSTEKLKEILPEDIKVLFAIEGCDYIKDEKEIEELRKIYLKHIDYIGNMIGFDHVVLSTDDMSFAKEVNEVYGLRAIYDYKNIKQKIKSDLLGKYESQIVEDILEKNAERIFQKIQ